LEQLWLGKNKITKLENLGHLKKLRVLSIQANRIIKIEGLEELENLEELYISHNGIEKLEGLEHNVKLTTIDISSNRIEKLENIGHLKELEELWASGNKFSSFNDVEKELGKLPKLHTVYFEHNPLQLQNVATYRNKVRLALGPSLQQIDATFIRA
jgi:protein phosphatase 1 regulatory subunit 7